MELQQFPFDVLRFPIKELPYEDMVQFSTVCRRFLDLCLPHIFPQVIVDTKADSTQFNPLSLRPRLNYLNSVKLISKFYNYCQGGLFTDILFRLSIFDLLGPFRLLLGYIIEMELKYPLMKPILLLDMDLQMHIRCLSLVFQRDCWPLLEKFATCRTVAFRQPNGLFGSTRGDGR
jgi:hypothetical protein